jgi:hypothetical protein
VPEFEKRWGRYARRVHSPWKMDDTAVPVRGCAHYLYRAVDKYSMTVASLLCRDRAGVDCGCAHLLCGRNYVQGTTVNMAVLTVH